MLIVLVSLEYYFTFKANKTNMVHVDDNLASPGHKKSTAPRSSAPMAELDRRNQNSLTRKGLTCYDCRHYIAQSDTETDNTDKNMAEKHTRAQMKSYFCTIRLLCSHHRILNCAMKLKRSNWYLKGALCCLGEEIQTQSFNTTILMR